MNKAQRNNKRLRHIEVGELVTIWPEKFEEAIVGIVVERRLGDQVWRQYDVAAGDRGIISVSRKQVFVDDEIPESPASAFSNAAFPYVSRVFPSLVANSLVSVQPMTAPASLLFSMDYKYETKEEAATRSSEGTLED